MYKEPIFLSSVFKERIWGGQKLKEEYGYELPNDKVGEGWMISALENGPSIVKNGPLAGNTLTDLWENYGKLFNKSSYDIGEYPLLVKMLDANDDLSVQVHPNDDYAREVENVPFGKTECWYILDAEKDATIVLGHHAKNKEEFDNMVEQGKWDELLQTKKVTPGEFYYVPSGTIHAIGKGIVILEIQQSSDITYRVYDYDRVDDNGNHRELHLERAKDVTTIPHQSTEFERKTIQEQGLTCETLVEEQYFSVYHWKLAGHVSRELLEDFLQVSVIEGEATIQIDKKKYGLKRGQHFIIPHSVKSYQLSGNAEFIVSHI